MHKMMVMAKAAPGRKEELAQWYDDIHLPQLRSVPGLVSTERHTLMPLKRPAETPQWDFMLIYELDGDPMSVLSKMSPEHFTWSDALESASTLSVIGMSCGVQREAT